MLDSEWLLCSFRLFGMIVVLLDLVGLLYHHQTGQFDVPCSLSYSVHHDAFSFLK